MQHKSEWIFYILGAALTLLWKLARYYYHGRNMGKTFKACLTEWLFESSAENAISWVTTIGVVWVIGSVYIDQLEIAWFGALRSIPVANSFAFLLGSIMEFCAPAAAKFILSKLPESLGGQK